MTLGERLRNEGRSEGLLKGRHEGEVILLRRQLTHRFGSIPPWADKKLQGATQQKLESWSTRTLDADSLEAIFA